MTGPEPDDAPPSAAGLTTAAEFIAALQRLRTWSGLTYRQLESKAAANGESLPSSTIATALSRSTLPREQFVDTLTRACGLGETEVRQWVEARRRIATSPGGAPTPPPPPPRAPRTAVVAGAAVALAVLAALGFAGVRALTDNTADAPSPTTSPGVPEPGVPEPGVPEPGMPGPDLPAVGAWVTLHPVRTPELCLTDGHDRSGRYRSEVLVQRPCRQAPLPRTFLKPLDGGLVQIQWHHPEHGIGCLTALRGGDGDGLVEPQDTCDDEEEVQRFWAEPLGSEQFRLHVGTSDRCLAPRDEDASPDAELVQQPCSDSPAQRITIQRVPPPG